MPIKKDSKKLSFEDMCTYIIVYDTGRHGDFSVGLALRDCCKTYKSFRSALIDAKKFSKEYNRRTFVIPTVEFKV